jgi:hypothetical protein
LSVRTSFKIFFGISGILFLLVHFLLITIYCLKQENKKKIHFYSQLYVYPFFHQGWQLFAPAPDVNYTLFFSVKEKGKQRTIDVLDPVIEMHRRNRLAGYGPLLIALVNSIHFFEKNALPEVTPLTAIKDDINFTIMQKIAESTSRLVGEDLPEDRRLILVVNEISGKKNRVYHN